MAVGVYIENVLKRGLGGEVVSGRQTAPNLPHRMRNEGERAL